MHLIKHYNIVDDEHLLVEYKDNEPLYYGSRKITKGKFIIIPKRYFPAIKKQFAIKYEK